MSRRKNITSASQTVGEDAPTADANPAGEPANEVPEAVTGPAVARGETGVGDPESGVAGLPADGTQRPWRRNFETLAVPGSGIYSGEDRKFAQVYIAFDKERPTDEQKAKMTEAGLRYRSQEKRWDMPATAASRQKVKALVAEFTGVTLGAAPRR